MIAAMQQNIFAMLLIFFISIAIGETRQSCTNFKRYKQIILKYKSRLNIFFNIRFRATMDIQHDYSLSHYDTKGLLTVMSLR